MSHFENTCSCTTLQFWKILRQRPCPATCSKAWCSNVTCTRQLAMSWQRLQEPKANWKLRCTLWYDLMYSLVGRKHYPLMQVSVLLAAWRVQGAYVWQYMYLVGIAAAIGFKPKSMLVLCSWTRIWLSAYVDTSRRRSSPDSIALIWCKAKNASCLHNKTLVNRPRTLWWNHLSVSLHGYFCSTVTRPVFRYFKRFIPVFGNSLKSTTSAVL